MSVWSEAFWGLSVPGVGEKSSALTPCLLVCCQGPSVQRVSATTFDCVSESLVGMHAQPDFVV